MCELSVVGLQNAQSESTVAPPDLAQAGPSSEHSAFHDLADQAEPATKVVQQPTVGVHILLRRAQPRNQYVVVSELAVFVMQHFA